MARKRFRGPTGLASAAALLLALSGCGGAADPAAAPGRPAAADDAPVEPAVGDAPLANTPPEIRGLRFEPEQPGTGDALRVVVDASDADGDPLFFRYEWMLAGEPVDSDVPKLVLTGATRGQDIALRVTASDGKDESGAAELTTEVRNLPPRLGKLAIEPAGGVLVGVPLVVRPEARDPDADPVSFRYEWTVNGSEADVDGATLETAKLSRGDKVRVVVFASDGEAESEGLASPELPVMNAPPKVVSQPGQPGEDGVFRYHVRAEDPDGEGRNLQFQLANEPEGMRIGAETGEITWQPAPGQTGTWSISVLVHDLEGGTGRQIFEVSAAGSASPPAELEPDL